MNEETIKELLSRRLDIKNNCLLKSEFKLEDKDKGEIEFYSIKPIEEIKFVSVSVEGETLQLINAKDFRIVLPKQYDFEKDEKTMDIILGEQSIKYYLNNRYVDVFNNNEILFIIIRKENEDLLKVKNGEDTYVPRAQTSLTYIGNGWELSAQLHLDLANPPIKFFNQVYDQPEPPTYQLNHLTLLLNNKIKDIQAIITSEELICILNGIIFRIDSYDINSGFLQLSRLSICNYGTTVKCELENQAIHIIDFLDNKYLLFKNGENNTLIYNNLLFNSNLELQENAPNLSAIISLYETLDVSNSEIISYINQPEDILNEADPDFNYIDKKIDQIKELMESEEELSKIEYIKNIYLIYNYGQPRFPNQIKHQSNFVIEEVRKLKEPKPEETSIEE